MPAARDAPALTRIDCRDPRLLKDACPGRCGRARKANQVLHRVELRLVWKMQRACGFEGQWRAIQHAGLKADRLRGINLAFDIGATGSIACKGIGVFRLKIAGYCKLSDPAADLPTRGSICVGIALSLVNTKGIDQVPIDQRMLARDLGSRTSCNLPSDLPCLKDGNGEPRHRQSISRRESDDASADNCNVSAARF